MSWAAPQTSRAISRRMWTKRTTSAPWTCHQCRHASSTSASSESSSAAPSANEIARARRYCLDLLRRYDTPSSLLLPYIPAHARDAYVALRAFNIEIARTADTTSTPTIGSLRLQFQRDAVAKSLAGEPPKQPIAILLSQAAGELAQRPGASPWRTTWFNRIIDTREKYLSNKPYPDLASLETYAENTYSALLYLTLQSVPMASLTADHVASHIGKAAGIAAVLRGLPLVAFPGPGNAHANQGAFAGGDVGATRRGAVMLPLDIMAQAGVREEDVLRNGPGAQGVRDAVFAVATRANDHLITARVMVENVRAGKEEGHAFEYAGDGEQEYPHAASIGGGGVGKGETPAQEVERAFGVFMPAVATQLWLDRLQKVDFDVFSPKLRVTDWRLPWQAWWAWRRRRF